MVSLHRPLGPRPIQATSLDVRGCVCLFEPLAVTCIGMDWRLFAKEFMLKIAKKIRKPFFFRRFWPFFIEVLGE